MDSIVRTTVDGLLAPRRLVPVLLVSVALVISQWWFSHSQSIVLQGVVMCAVFVALGPLSWRLLFPIGTGTRTSGEVSLRLLVFGTFGALVIGAVGFLPRVLFDLPASFLSTNPSLFIAVAFFWVGGWGLGRDIDLELGLERARRRSEELEREKERAQLLAIKNHLDPHFLFNTLNAIAEWCRQDGEVAERAVLKLASMLRTILQAVQAATWSLSSELGLLDDLFELHHARDPERFQVVRRGYEDVPTVNVPAMILLPLAENAMKHGPAAGHRGQVTLDVAVLDDTVVVRLENPGAYAGPRDGGEGLRLVRRRLALAYGRDDLLTIEAVPGSEARTRVTVSLPRHGAGAA